jgi:hypothetical protein
VDHSFGEKNGRKKGGREKIGVFHPLVGQKREKTSGPTICFLSIREKVGLI